MIRKALLLFWTLTLALNVWQLIEVWDALPADGTFATHWDGADRPNGYSTRGGLYAIWIAVLLSLNVWIPAIGWLMRILPRSLINLPNKDYWLSTPELAKQAAERMAGYMAVIMGVSNVYMFHILGQVVANAQPEPNRVPMDFSIGLFIGYIAFICIISIGLILWTFRAPRDAAR